MLATIGWPDVVIALIAGAPSIIAALYAHTIRREIRPPSGGTLGAVAEAAQQSGRANHMLLKAIDGDTVGRKYVEQGITPPAVDESGPGDTLGQHE